MKKFKFYTSIILVISLLSALSIPVFADYAEYSASWLSPVDGVSGYIYSDTPYGFIIKDYDPETYEETTGLVSDQGIILPQSIKNFNYITEDGYVSYRNWFDDGSILSGVMDLSGNEVGPSGYDEIEVINANRFLCYIENEEGWYDTGVVDAQGNEIIPFGKYSWITWNSLIKCYDGETYVTDIYDMDGNLINSETEGIEVELTSQTDRYLCVDWEQGKTYIRSVDGHNIAEINGRAQFRGAIVVSEYAVIDSTWYVATDYVYDFDGNLVRTESYNDTYGRPYSKLNLDELNQYQTEYSNGAFNVIDKFGNVTFRSEDLYYVYNDKYIVLKTGEYDWETETSTEDFSILDMNGNVIVPFGQGFDDICYSADLDMFALGNDGQISLMKPTPITVMVGGNKVIFDQNPVVKDSRTLVPLRAIFEALGATVNWNPETMTVTSTLGDITVSLTIGSNILTVNGQDITLDVPADVLNGRTLVPVRAISEAFKCNVDWNGDTRTVSIR